MSIFSSLVGAAAVVLIGIALGVMSMSPPEYDIARGATIGAALSILLAYGLWAISTPIRLLVLIGVGILAAILVFVGMPMALRWINSVEKENNKIVKEEEQIKPRYVGTISPSGPDVKFSSQAGGPSAKLEIGDSGSVLLWDGPASQPMLTFYGSTITVEVIDGQVKLTTDVRDTNGELVAELIRNEWMVAPPPKTWDRNYSTDSVEVIDPRGKVAIQVVALPDRIQIQGEWHDQAGYGIRLVSISPGSGSDFVPLKPHSPDKNMQIKRRFAYPSGLHLGELAQ